MSASEQHTGCCRNMNFKTQSRNRYAWLLFLLLTLLSAACDSQQPTSSQGSSEQKKTRVSPPAIEFPPGLAWLNVEKPLRLADLKGKVVILDFWTYGCINCLHVADELRIIEQKYPRNVAVVSVHTPKFDNEKNLETLRENVLRYDLEHPVINDTDYLIARAYGMRAWPTLIVIDPAGRVLGRLEGEKNVGILERVIDRMLREHASILNTKPIPLKLEVKSESGSLLNGPSKIAVSDQYVAISDSLNHRVILADHQGRVVRYIGGVDKAVFRNPQGLAFTQDGLYVADTGNHRLRLISLPDGKVETIAGTGKNSEIHRAGEFDAQDVDLRSPWGLAYKKPWLYVAMAGSHQIWRYHTEKKRVEVYAGNSREGIDDGSLKQSTFSQPSGLAFIGEKLFVADSEDSAVRQIDLVEGRVKTLIGKGLFEFGDIDGRFDDALLQHLTDIASDGRFLYIADRYNHKVKRLDLDTETIETLFGTGQPGRASDENTVILNEPFGLAIFGEGLLVSDTNNHRILYFSNTDGSREWKLSED